MCIAWPLQRAQPRSAATSPRRNVRIDHCLAVARQEDMVMRSEFLDGDTLFAVAVAGAIGFGATNLAIQVNKERAAFRRYCR
jgi:hypothetical protein